MARIWNPDTAQWETLGEDHPAINEKDDPQDDVYNPYADFPDDDDPHGIQAQIDAYMKQGTSGGNNVRQIGSGGSKGGGGSSYQQKKYCRHEPTDVFELGGVTYYGGSESKVGFFNGITVCLLGDKTEPKPCVEVAKGVKNRFGALAKMDFLARPIDISIDWKDMGAPPLSPGFWETLHESVKKDQAEDVLVYCMGGHGRTGTALCAILVCCGGYSPKDALDYVRESYCDQAVESDSQIRYLNWLWYQQPGNSE